MKEYYTFEFIDSHFKIIVSVMKQSDELAFLYSFDLVFPYDRYSTVKDVLQEIHLTSCGGRMKENTRYFLNRYAPYFVKYVNIYLKQQRKKYGL